MTETKLQPDVDEVLQEEEYPQSIPVCITEAKSPVRVQQLPRKGGATMTKTITTVPGQRVLAADHRRGKATLIGNTSAAPILVAFTEAAAQAEATMMLWPPLVPLDLDATTDVYLAVPATPGTSAVVGIATFLWAEGE